MSRSNQTTILDRLHKLKLVPVVNPPSVEAGMKLAEILLAHNLPVAEITFRTPCAAETISAICAAYPELLVLAGTVLDGHQAKSAVDAGAAAIVSPGCGPRLAASCRRRQLLFIPGVCTPGEVQTAREMGLTSLKFFPAEMSGGVKMLSFFRELYPSVRFMPTGGISQDNIREYLALENVLCCGGTWLSPSQLMESGRWQDIEQRISAAVRMIAGLQQSVA